MYVRGRGACRPGRGWGLVSLDTRTTDSKKQAPTIPSNEEMWDELEDSAGKATFSRYCSWGEGSVAPGSHRATSLPCQQQKNTCSDAAPIRTTSAATLQLPCLGPYQLGRAGWVMGPGRVLSEAAHAAPQVPATDATSPSHWFSHHQKVIAGQFQLESPQVSYCVLVAFIKN